MATRSVTLKLPETSSALSKSVIYSCWTITRETVLAGCDHPPSRTMDLRYHICICKGLQFIICGV